MLWNLWVPKFLACASHLSLPPHPILCLLVVEEVGEVQKLQVYWQVIFEVLADEDHQLPHPLLLIHLAALLQVDLLKE